MDISMHFPHSPPGRDRRKTQPFSLRAAGGNSGRSAVTVVGHDKKKGNILVYPTWGEPTAGKLEKIYDRQVDGTTTAKWHAKVKGMGPTVTVIRFTNGRRVVRRCRLNTSG